jgi:uncharacterized protein YecE (DUF72 family)
MIQVASADFTASGLGRFARVGCSGWQYRHWRGLFYPPGLPQREWLSHYASRFNTVEINSTFYGLPSEESVSRWGQMVGDDFIFTVKGGRLITHTRRLATVDAEVDRFCQRMRLLQHKLGPVLWQLPPSLQRDDRRLEGFLGTLAPDVQHVVEFRHISWWHPEVYGLLKAFRVAICCLDMPGLTSPAVCTADCVYVRFHGREHLYNGSYDVPTLNEWATTLVGMLPVGGRAYAYFNNDAHAYATENALTFAHMLGAS